MKYPEQALMYLSVEIVAYDDWSLLDMRIHDISLVADLTTHDPNDPYPADGTSIGSVDNISTQTTDRSISQAISCVLAEWILVVFWPALEVIGTYLILGVLYNIHYTIDLLSNLDMKNACAGAPDEENTRSDDLSWLIGVALPVLAINALIKGGLGVMTSTEMSFGIFGAWTPSLIAMMVFGLALVSLGVALAITYVNNAISSGSLTQFQAAWFYLMLAFLALNLIIGTGGVKGFLSVFLVTILVMYWGYWEVETQVMSYLSEIMKWTKIVVVFLFFAFLVLASIHFVTWSTGG